MMPDRGKVIKGLEAHEKGCGHRSHYCDVMECPYRYWDESCNIEEMCHDAIALLKEQPEIVRCKNCKYLIDHYGFMDDGYCKRMREKYNVKFKPLKDWFCADGERRDDDA